MGLFVGIAVLALVVGARYDVRGRKGMRAASQIISGVDTTRREEARRIAVNVLSTHMADIDIALR